MEEGEAAWRSILHGSDMFANAGARGQSCGGSREPAKCFARNTAGAVVGRSSLTSSCSFSLLLSSCPLWARRPPLPPMRAFPPQVLQTQ